MIFGKKIKELREERGLLQRQLSAALEIDTPMYSKIERGEERPNVARFLSWLSSSKWAKRNCSPSG